MDPFQESNTLKAALNILRSAPPSDTEKNISSLQVLLEPNPDALAELAQHVHLPLQTTVDSDKNTFVTCSWNRLSDGSFRSPFQSLDENKLQAQANELWATYRNMYFGSNAVSSVYVKETNASTTRYCFLMQHKSADVGEWNSAHLVHVVTNATTGTTSYSMQSNVRVMLRSEISAHVSKHTTTSSNATSPFQYMETIGPMLESVETELRSSLENVHFAKLHDTITGVRRKKRPTIVTPGMNHTDMLNQAVLARAAMQKKKG